VDNGFWLLGIPAVAVIALAAAVGASWGRARDRAAPPALTADRKPRPVASRLLSTLFCLAILSALMMSWYRKSMDQYPLEAAVLLTVFVVGGAAGIVNRRIFGFWI
jgi:apolipoprotein N-acyltransferase